MTIIPARVGLQQRVFPEYRAPFFELLAKSCLHGFNLFSGLPRADEAIHTCNSLIHGSVQAAKNIHLSRDKSYLLMQRGFLEWLKSWQPNVLIVEANPRYLSTPTAIQWMHAQGKPVIGWGLGAPLSNKVEGFVRNNFLRSLDAVIAYSKAGAQQYISSGLDPKKVFVAPNAVSPKPTQPAPFRQNSFKNGKASLLFVGRLQERKNLDVLLHACAAMPKEIQPALTIVGDGPDRPRLVALATDLYPQTQFPGAKHGSELDPYFNQADLFVLPGTGGLAVQQAMAHALPVMVGQADGTQGDLVRPENGWVLTKPDAATITQNLVTALADVPRLRAMGNASYRIVAEEVNLENMVACFAKAIKSVL
jgi:glycosyltransferase involved in cell wall biosynthesis